MMDDQTFNTSKDSDDQFWLEDVRKGDERAFEILFKKYYLQLTRFAWRHVNSQAIAEELVQDLLATLWENRGEWDMKNEKTIRSYLYKSVKNMSLNYIKHQKIKDKFDSEWVEDKEKSKFDSRDTHREEEIREAIFRAVEELPSRSKMTYKLHRYDGLTYDEIAEVMDVSVKTVESQMSRALQMLRERLSYLLPILLFSIMVSL